MSELSKTGVKITWGRDVHHNSQNLKIILIQCKKTKLLLKIACSVIVKFLTKYCILLKMMFAKTLHCRRNRILNAIYLSLRVSKQWYIF